MCSRSTSSRVELRLHVVPGAQYGYEGLDRTRNTSRKRESRPFSMTFLPVSRIFRPTCIASGRPWFRRGSHSISFVLLPRGVLTTMPHELVGYPRTFAHRWNGDGENVQELFSNGPLRNGFVHDHPFPGRDGFAA